MNTESQDFSRINILLGVAWSICMFGGMLALLGLAIKLLSKTTVPFYASYLVVAGLIIFAASWIFSEFIRRRR